MKGPIIVVATLACMRAARASPLELSEPDAPPPREVTEQGTSPVYYRLSPKTVSVLSRTSIGGHTRWSGDTSFTLDLLTGAEIRFGRDANTGLWIEGRTRSGSAARPTSTRRPRGCSARGCASSRA